MQQAYYILGICSIGTPPSTELKDLKKAKNYLVAAYWNSTKKGKAEASAKEADHEDKDAALEIESIRQKAFARLNEFQGEFQTAIVELSSAIYLDSTRFGPEHPSLCQSYYIMGRLLEKIDPHENQFKTMRYFDLIVKIWFRVSQQYIIEKRFYKRDEEQLEFVEVLTRKEGEKILENLKGRHG